MASSALTHSLTVHYTDDANMRHSELHLLTLPTEIILKSVEWLDDVNVAILAQTCRSMLQYLSPGPKKTSRSTA